VKIGDLVKFAKEHTADPGLDYCGSWLGVVLNIQDESIDIQWMDTSSTLELRGPSQYDAMWWNTLDYEPFEVVSENR
jgi:hypothetical protein